MTIAAFDPKDPNDVDFFTFDYVRLLASGETITGIAIAVDDGDGALVVGSSSYVNTYATVQLSAGTLNVVYVVRCRATTSLGRILDLSGSVLIASN